MTNSRDLLKYQSERLREYLLEYSDNSKKKKIIASAIYWTLVDKDGLLKVWYQ